MKLSTVLFQAEVDLIGRARRHKEAVDGWYCQDGLSPARDQISAQEKGRKVDVVFSFPNSHCRTV